MKALFCNLLILMIIGSSACGLKNKSDSPGALSDTVEVKTTLRFVATEHDFGQVREGEKVVCSYEVVNTGKYDLFIHEVKVSCGCTSPKYDKRPIRPGGKSTIEVTFDTNGRPGNQRRSVVVVTNTDPSNANLYFSCQVIPK